MSPPKLEYICLLPTYFLPGSQHPKNSILWDSGNGDVLEGKLIHQSIDVQAVRVAYAPVYFSDTISSSKLKWSIHTCSEVVNYEPNFVYPPTVPVAKVYIPGRVLLPTG